MAVSIGSLLRALAGERRRATGAPGLRWRKRGHRRAEHSLLATEPLESRSMLAVVLAGFVPGGTIQLLSTDVGGNDGVRMLLVNNTVQNTSVIPPVSVVTPGFSFTDLAGAPIFGAANFYPIVDPSSGALNVAGVQITGATNFSTSVTFIDTLTAVANVTGIGAWNTDYSVNGQSGTVSFVNPVSLTVNSGATVGIDGAFAGSAGRAGTVSLNALGIVVGKASPVSGADSLTLSTLPGSGTILLADAVAANTLKISTNAAFDVSESITAKTLNLTVNGGATQSGGAVTASTSLSLTASGGNVTFNKVGNNIAKIASITAVGQDIVLNTIGTVTQTGAIQADSLSLTVGGGVTLDNTLNDVDAVAIKAGGDISFTDANELQIGTAAVSFGLTANGGVANVTVTTANDLTQTAVGAIQAAQFTAKLLTGAGGGRLINLDSSNNQVSNFLAETTAFGGGGIAFVNAANKALTVGDGVNPISSGSNISIKTQGTSGTLTINSALITPASITLESGGKISQSSPTASLTANSLSVLNTAATGIIALATASNDVSILEITNNASGGAASKGIEFKGSNAGSNNLQIAGKGVIASGGDISIDANLRPLAIGANISTVGGNVNLVAADGIAQTGGGISGNTLTVTNGGTGGTVTLTSALNDVSTVAIKNTAPAPGGTVQYTDANDLTLGAVGGIVGIDAGDSITLVAGKNFSAPAGTGLAALTGSITVSATGTVSLAAASTAGAGATFTGSGIAVTAPIAVGGGSVTLTAATAGVSVASAVTATQDIVLSGPTAVSLPTGGSLVANGQIVLTSTAGGLTAAAGVPLTAGADVVVTTSGSATFGGPVTSGNDFVVNATSAGAGIVVGGAVTAPAGAVTLTAGAAVTSTAAIIGDSFSSTSGGLTSIGGAVTTTAGLTVVAGGTFGIKAALTAGGVLSGTSAGNLLVNGAVQAAEVTLAAGTATSPANVTVKTSIGSTAGPVAITATGGKLTTITGGTITAAGDLSLAGTTGAVFAAALAAGGDVDVTSAAGNVNFGAGAGIAAAAQAVTLSAATGITQDTKASVGIQSASIVATNGTAGAITLDSPLNNADTFRATNAAALAGLTYVDADAITLALPGTSTTNGPIAVEALGGGIAVAGPLSSGTADTSLVANGAVAQAATGAITANKLGATTSNVPAANVTLNVASNTVNIIHGATQGGTFFFTGAGPLQIGVANVVDLVTTAGGDPGADIYVAAGQGGAGALLVAADSLNAGIATIGLQGKGGIADQVNVTIAAAELALLNAGTGNITLASPTSAFATLAATSGGGSTISILDNSAVTLDTVTVATLTVTGLQAPGGTVVLNAAGAIAQTGAGKVVATDATFISTGDVTLDAAPNNNVANLAIKAVGNVAYTDLDSFAVGVGGAGIVGTSGAPAGTIDLVATLGSVTLNADVSTTSSLPWDPGLPTTATTIKAAGAITQTAGQVVSGDLAMVAAGGAISLAQATNDIANLRAFAGAAVTYVDANDFEVGFDSDAAPVAGVGTVTVNAGIATFTTPQFPPLVVGDVIVINLVPYRITAVAGANFTLASGNGIPLTIAAAPFGIQRPKTVFPALIPALVRGVTAGGDLTLTAGPTLVAPNFDASLGPIGLGLLRVTEGLAFAGAMTLEAGLDSRPLYVDFVVTNTTDPLLFGGSMRNMIEYANVNAGRQTINGATRVQPMRLVFDELDYPVMDVVPTAALPLIVQPLDINGTLVEASVTNPRVGINGGTIPTTSVVNGLNYAPGSNESRITGLAVYGYATGSGFMIRSANNTIINSYAGLQRDGTTITANKIGIQLSGQTSTTNTIGTVLVNELAANVIGGNTFAGIVARNGSTGNAIVGNFIGTDAAGNALGNTGFGISLEGVNGNVIGTRNAVRPDGTAAASNVIANNNNSGLRIINSRAANANLGNLVENNLIDANGIDGIQVSGSAFQVIGGQQPRQANVITRQIGSPTTGGNAVSVTSSNDISIFANFLGVDEAGSNTLGNARAGVLVDQSVRTVIAAGNRIGRNATGVTVRNGATANRIEGNFIGTNEFDADLGNTGDGVAIDRSVGNFVRFGNVIANNDRHGVNITDSAAATLASGNVVSANTIRGNGTAGTGTGVRVAGGARSTIGGGGVGNVIISNANEGILLEPTSFTGSPVGVAIQGNYVGTSPLEQVDPTLGNRVGIRLRQATNAVIDGRNVIANAAEDGVRIEGSNGTTLGSGTAGAGNVITANTAFGVVVTDRVTGQAKVVTNQGTGVFGNTISGNAAGVFVQGTNLVNGTSTTSSVVVGRRSITGLPLVGQANTITGNAGAGVTIDSAQSVLVQGNSIYGNTDALGNPALPISIINGGNAGAVAPTLTSATISQRSGGGAQVTVQGSFAAAGTGTVTVVNGRATFSTPQPGATVGATVLINGIGYAITSVITSVPGGNTVVQLQGNPSTMVVGTGRVASRSGVATFSVPQAPSLVGQSIIVAGRSYAVTSLSPDGRTGRLAGNPTFLVSSFSTVQPVSFSMLAANLIGQQYVIDLYLNDPGDGMPGADGTGTGFAMRRYLGQAVVTIGATGPGTFTASVALPAGIVPAGQYITATASTMRAAAGTAPFSTSQASPIARQVVLAGPGR